MTSNLLILTTRQLQTAPRVLREIQALSGSHKIWVIGANPPANSSVTYMDISVIGHSFIERLVNLVCRILRINLPVIPLISKRYRDIDKIITEINPGYLITHEPHFLPYLVVLKRKKGFKLIYNAHEYHPLEFSDKWVWNLFSKDYYTKIYKNCLPLVDLLINVCKSIADKCLAEFGKGSVVIPNASVYYDLVPVDNTLQKSIKIIHHGGCIPSRKIEEMIKMAGLLGQGYQLDLMLTLNSGPYFEKIQSMAGLYPNVNIIEPVKFEEIVPFTNKYDIGLFLLPPVNFNYSVALPNKFFEYIQARLCIAIGPSIEMKRYVDEYKLGIVSENFEPETLAKKIKELSRAQILSHKQNAHFAASELSSEKFNLLFSEAVNNL